MAHREKWSRSLSTWLILCGIILLFGVAACQSHDQPGAGSAAATAPQAAAAPTAATATTVPPTAMPTVQPATPTPVPTEPEPTAVPTAETARPTATGAPSATLPPPATATPKPAPIAAPASGDLPVRIVIPDLKLNAPVAQMGWKVVQTDNGPRSDWVIPQYEAGHHVNSAALGEQGNVVISGHNNIFGQVFRPISLAWDDDKRTKIDDFTDGSDVLNGRTINLFDAAGQQFSYTITAFYRLKDTGVPPEQRIANGRFMQPTDSAQLTLITCWPPSSNTHRLVVIAKPAS